MECLIDKRGEYIIMKKLLSLLTILSVFTMFFTNLSVEAAEIVDSQKSEAIIGFYESPTLGTDDKHGGDGFDVKKDSVFPKTGEKRSFYLTSVGILMVVFIAIILSTKKRKMIGDRIK